MAGAPYSFNGVGAGPSVAEHMPRRGRFKALAVLDKVMAKEKNLIKLEQELQKRFDTEPFLFFTNVVVPLIPRNALDRGEDEGMGQTALTPDQLVFLMDQSVVPTAKSARARLRKDRA